MPELPEVETTRLGIMPHVVANPIVKVELRHSQLRYPLTQELQGLVGQGLATVERRGKYLLLVTQAGDRVLVHLGMSGSLRLVTLEALPEAHDHVDLVFADGRVLRYRDPRRFGLWLWLGQAPGHPLLAKLGPEPLSDAFDGAYLFAQSRGTDIAIKKWLMNSRKVVGVGNIYANEALFLAKVQPLRPAASLTLAEAKRLAAHVKAVLTRAIRAGGTTLKDFIGSDGQPGYFAVDLQVYGRGGQACRCCRRTLLELRLDNRTTVYCRHCQR